MEFFDWLNFPQYFLDFFSYNVTTAEQLMEMKRLALLISVGVAGGLYLLGLIFGGIGLYTIAKREGVAHGWLGFLPFANTWFTGKLAGEASFFGQKMKRTGLYAMLAELLYTALGVFTLVIFFLLANPEYYLVTINESTGVASVKFMPSYLPEGMGWLADASLYCDIVSYLMWFVALVFFCVMFTAFYRKYYARSPFLMVFLSVILPARGFTIFAVRNNRAVDYNEYMRRKMEEYARANNPYGPYNNGSYRNGPYGNGQGGGENGQGGASSPDPFSDFGGDPQGGPQGGPQEGPQEGPQDGGRRDDDDPFSDF